MDGKLTGQDTHTESGMCTTCGNGRSCTTCRYYQEYLAYRGTPGRILRTGAIVLSCLIVFCVVSDFLSRFLPFTRFHEYFRGLF